MKISKLLKALDSCKIYGSENVEPLSISDDSRKVGKGALFVAVKGIGIDGHKFIPDAIKKGAVAVVGEREPKKKWLKNIAYVKVDNSRSTLALLASSWYGNPSKSLKIIGITGTKGKTTTAEILYAILNGVGLKVGLISSIHAKIGSKTYDTGLHVTNPEPLPLHKFLKKMVDEKCKFAIIEVTSHGIDQGRIAGIDFDIGILTNVAHEHLDYHKTLKKYRDTKTRLFKNTKIAILNKDDPSFSVFWKAASRSKKITYSANKEADYKVAGIFENKKTHFKIHCGNKGFDFRTRYFGEYNLLNIAAAVAASRELGVSWNEIQKQVLLSKPPVGRLQEVKNNKGISIYIDFAHTPGSLEKVLGLLKRKTKGNLISVFGCAGERDTKKRSMMGEISTKLAKFSVFTAEDPRSEDIKDILDEMEKGAKRTKAEKLEAKNFDESIHRSKENYYLRIPKRGEAISFAIRKLARRGDAIVICGKGHEKSMAYNGVEYPWSDLEAIKLALVGKVKKIKRS